MKINSIGQMSSGNVGTVNNNEEAAIRKQIQSLRKELSSLNKNTELYFAGLLERQEEKIREVYGQEFNIQKIKEKEGWILLQLAISNEQ